MDLVVKRLMTTLVLFLIIMLDHTRLCWHNLQKGHREIRNFKLE